MKLSILVLPIILAQGYAENQILKRSLFSAAGDLLGVVGNSVDNVFGGSFDNIASDVAVAGSGGTNAVADAGGNNLVGNFDNTIKGSSDSIASDGAIAGSIAADSASAVTVPTRPRAPTLISSSGKQISHTQFFSEIDRLLSVGQYSRAKSFVDHFDISNLGVHNNLVGLAIRKGDDSFLVSVINSKPRAVLSDLKLMKYIRETSDPERANYFLKAIANNMGDTGAIGNNRKNAFYNLVRLVQNPYEEVLQLAKSSYSKAINPAEKEALGDIIRYIEKYSVSKDASPEFFHNLHLALLNKDFFTVRTFLGRLQYEKFPMAIANNIGETGAIANNGGKAYYDLLRGYGRTPTPSEKALQLTNKFYSEARSPGEQKVWGEIIQYIQTYSVRVSPNPNYFYSLEKVLRGNNKNKIKLMLTNVEKLPIEDYFSVLMKIISKGNEDLISYVFSKGTIRRSAITDAEFMKLAREIHPGSRGEELSRLIGKEIPAQRREEAVQYAFKQAKGASSKAERSLWMAATQDIMQIHLK